MAKAAAEDRAKRYRNKVVLGSMVLMMKMLAADVASSGRNNDSRALFALLSDDDDMKVVELLKLTQKGARTFRILPRSNFERIFLKFRQRPTSSSLGFHQNVNLRGVR